MVRVVLLMLMIAGCTGTTASRPGQDIAVRIIWIDCYGMTDDAPEIEWLSNNGWKIGDTTYQGISWAGWRAQVSCGEDCDWPYWKTQFAHELMHFRTEKLTGDIDVGHLRGDWSKVGEAIGALNRASLNGLLPQ
jgi:hypothetical protein